MYNISKIMLFLYIHDNTTFDFVFIDSENTRTSTVIGKVPSTVRNAVNFQKNSKLLYEISKINEFTLTQSTYFLVTFYMYD